MLVGSSAVWHALTQSVEGRRGFAENSVPEQAVPMSAHGLEPEITELGGLNKEESFGALGTDIADALVH